MMLYSSGQYVFVILTGLFSALNLTCVVIAYQNDGSATVSLLSYIALVYAFVADVSIFGQSFLALEITGAAIITFFNLFTIWYKMKYHPEEEENNDIKAEARAKKGDY